VGGGDDKYRAQCGGIDISIGMSMAAWRNGSNNNGGMSSGEKPGEENRLRMAQNKRLNNIRRVSNKWRQQ